MGRDRDARPGTSSGPGRKARSGQITGDTQLSLLTAKHAGHTGLNWIMQAVFSTSTWYAFAGQVSRPFSLLRLGMLLRGRSTGSRRPFSLLRPGMLLRGRSQSIPDSTHKRAYV